MQKSKSLSHHQLNQYRQKFNHSQHLFNQKYTRDISTPKKPTNLMRTTGTQSKQTTIKNTASSVTINDLPSKKQILHVMINSNQSNPQRKSTLIDLKGSILLAQLDSKAKEMTDYAEQNSTLLTTKSNLENKITQLKRSIAQERKRLSEAQCNCNILKNEIESTKKRRQEKSQLTRQLGKGISQNTLNVRSLLISINQNQAESEYNKKYINELERVIEELSLKVTNINFSLMKQNSERVERKESLRLELKTMENNAILYRQLLSQKCNIQATVDNVLYDNKMQSTKKVGKSRLSIQSNKK